VCHRATRVEFLVKAVAAIKARIDIARVLIGFLDILRKVATISDCTAILAKVNSQSHNIFSTVSRYASGN
jgi:hypothetical protein